MSLPDAARRFAFRFALPTALWFFGPHADAQVRVAWQDTTPPGAYGFDASSDIAVDPSGVVYVGGHVPSQSGDPAPGLTLRRFDPDGTIAWSRSFALAATSPPYVAISPSDQSVYLVAAYYDSGHKIQVLKYDAAGNFSWGKSLPGLDASTVLREETRFAVVDAGGNVYVGATAAGNARIVSLDGTGAQRFSTLLPIPLTPACSPVTVDVLAYDPHSGDVFAAGHACFDQDFGTSTYVARLTPAGTIAWLTQELAASRVWPRALAVDAQQRVSVLLETSTNPGLAPSSHAVHRFDGLGQPAGSITWTFSFPTVTEDVASIDVAGDGSLVASGSYYANPGQASFVALYDSGLNPVWHKTAAFPPATTSVFTSVHFGSDRDVTTIGLRRMEVLFPFQTFQTDFHCVRYDAAGNPRWTYDPGTTPESREIVAGSVVDSNGRVWLAVGEAPLPPGSPYATKQITIALEPQSHSFCHGNGLAVPCPCGNTSSPEVQAGCVNSTGNAGKLADSGDASLAGDTLTLTCTGVGPSTIALFVQGTTQVQPVLFGDGLRCFGGTLARLYTKTASGGVVSAPGAGDPSVHARAATLGGPISAGARRVYQAYYRDPAPAFCMSPAGSTFNLSNALLVAWIP